MKYHPVFSDLLSLWDAAMPQSRNHKQSQSWRSERLRVTPAYGRRAGGDLSDDEHSCDRPPLPRLRGHDARKHRDDAGETSQEPAFHRHFKSGGRSLPLLHKKPATCHFSMAPPAPRVHHQAPPLPSGSASTVSWGTMGEHACMSCSERAIVTRIPFELIQLLPSDWSMPVDQ